MTTPWINDGLATVPYLTLAEFKSMPTFMDYENLISGGSQAQQDAELYNVLLRASGWADNYCEQRLQAHVVYEQMRTEMDSRGRIYLHPKNTPVRQITGIAYGSEFQNLTELTDLTQIWIEDSRGIVVSVIPYRGMFTGSLEFGGVPFSGAPVFVELRYIAGYANTTLSGSVSAGGTSLPLADPTGLQPPTTGMLGTLTGSTARIWDPQNEEAVTVASGYTQGNTTVPVSSGLQFAHSAGAGVSELPPEAKQAVCALAVALLCREDVTDEEPFAGSTYGPALRRGGGGTAGGLVDTAWGLLDPYRRIR